MPRKLLQHCVAASELFPPYRSLSNSLRSEIEVHPSRYNHFLKLSSHPLLFLLCPRRLSLLPHSLQIPRVSIVLIITIRIAVLCPVALFEHSTTSGILEFLGLFLGLFLVDTFFLPFGECLGRDRCEIAGELVAFGLEEVFEGEGVERGVGHQGLLGGALFLGLDDETRKVLVQMCTCCVAKEAKTRTQVVESACTCTCRLESKSAYISNAFCCSSLPPLGHTQNQPYF